MAIQHFSVSHIGSRKENQDRLLVLTDKNKGLLAIVADGLGGHQGGSKAASEVCGVAEEIWYQTSDIRDEETFLRKLVSAMHESVRCLNEWEKFNSRSVVAAILITPQARMAIHVGDCRVIQYKAKFSPDLYLRQINLEARTYDHTVGQMQLSMGNISTAQYINSKAKSQLLSVLGGKEIPEPEITVFKILPSVFIVCSDGFWELLENLRYRELKSILNDEIKLNEFICKAVHKNEKSDNTSLIVIKDDELLNSVKINPKLYIMFSLFALGFVLMVYIMLVVMA